MTVRLSTARMLRELAKAYGLSVDELLNELIKPTNGKAWLTCSLCGVRIKATNISSHGQSASEMTANTSRMKMS